MLFNSWQFAIFFPVVSILYFTLPHRFRWLLLLAASCIFYMVFIPIYIFVLLALILIDYAMGILIEQRSGKKRKIYLIISIVSTCIALFIFKYFNFFNANFSALARLLHWNYPVKVLPIILPLGISFHTFQSLSYVIEVYRGRQKAERNLGVYSLYVMFYPQLVAGPIERPYNLLHQFYERHYFEYKRVTDGIKLMAWGLFKKIVIADRLAVFVNRVYGAPADYQGITLITATVFFAFQIYCDFSGYSDIAIGSAQVMGFRLMDNFKSPYLSKSIAEFWTRWHISLSTWFRDYLYIPMGGNRVAKWRWSFNLFITFLISGLWHGASWTFVIWGALHGFYYLFSVWTKGLREKLAEFTGLNRFPRLKTCSQALITFSLVCFAWIFFRAESLSDAFYIVRYSFFGIKGYALYLINNLSVLGKGRGLFVPLTLGDLYGFLTLVFLLAFMGFVHYIQRQADMRQMFSGRSSLVRWAFYYAFIFGILFLGKFNNSPFIYFQF